MHKNIQFLAEDAGMDEFGFIHGWETALVGKDAIEKFSELIIQKCSEVAMDNLSSPASAILCHFESD